MTDDKKRWIPYKWELLLLLWFAFFFNQADRQSYNVVLPLLTEDLGLTSVQTGLIGSIFLWCYALLVPLGGYLGDVGRRKWVLFGSLLLASGCTFMSGAATGMITLVIIRGFGNGGGEACYFPSANSLIGQYHHKTRALAMGIHQTALYSGLILSGFLAGFLGDRYGWRSPFFFFGAMALILTLLILWRVKDVAQPTAEKGKKTQRVPLRDLFHGVLCKPTFWALCLAFSLFFFVICGFNTWISTFLHEKFEMNLANAGLSSMAYHMIAAAIGVLLGGKISDVLALKFPKIRIKVAYVGLFFAAPFIYVMGSTDTPWICFAALACFGFFRGVYDSNVYASLFDVIEPKYRASATGLMLTFVFFIGAFAPVVLGWAKDTVGLTKAMSYLSLGYVLGGIILVIASLTTLHDDFYDESLEPEPVTE
ncbi:MAG: MFS transporter [Kiritimatiellia bacterium]